MLTCAPRFQIPVTTSTYIERSPANAHIGIQSRVCASAASNIDLCARQNCINVAGGRAVRNRSLYKKHDCVRLYTTTFNKVPLVYEQVSAE